MPRLIFKCPYIKGGTSAACSHLENYVQYMATRSGVDRIDPGRNGWPATINQKEMIEQILRDFPLSCGMFEYEDYRATPTRSNASEFISQKQVCQRSDNSQQQQLPVPPGTLQ